MSEQHTTQFSPGAPGRTTTTVEVAGRLVHLRDNSPGGAVAVTLAAEHAELPGWRRALLERVRASGTPVLVLRGDADAVLPAHHVEAAAAALPDDRVHVFPDTGHMPQIERSGEFVALAREFVASVEQSRPVP